MNGSTTQSPDSLGSLSGSPRVSLKSDRATRPTRAGWWLWIEGGDIGDNEEFQSAVETTDSQFHDGEWILVGDGGTHVVGDDEFLQMTGRDPEHDGWNENYWEGTETTQRMMPGFWISANTSEQAGR